MARDCVRGSVGSLVSGLSSSRAGTLPSGFLERKSFWCCSPVSRFMGISL